MGGARSGDVTISHCALERSGIDAEIHVLADQDVRGIEYREDGLIAFEAEISFI